MRIAFVGDVCSSGIWEQKISGGKDLVSADLNELLRGHRYVLANLEGPVSDSVEARVTNSVGSVAQLKQHGVNIYSLANNHSFDLGYQGYLNTVKVLESENIRYFGAGKNLRQATQILYLTQDNFKLGLIGAAHREGEIASANGAGVFCVEHIRMLQEVTKEARAKADRVILIYHGGEEFTLFPMPARRKLLHQLSRLPVDLIICHHPHVLQGSEIVNDTSIFYSLGNFMVDSPRLYSKNYTNTSAVLSIDIDQSTISHTLHPILIDRDAGVVKLDPTDDTLKRSQQSSDFEAYNNKWQQEAHRVFRQEKLPAGRNASGSVFGKLLTASFWRTLITSLADEHSRPILVGALKYSIRKKLGLLP